MNLEERRAIFPSRYYWSAFGSLPKYRVLWIGTNPSSKGFANLSPKFSLWKCQQAGQGVKLPKWKKDDRGQDFVWLPFEDPDWVIYWFNLKNLKALGKSTRQSFEKFDPLLTFGELACFAALSQFWGSSLLSFFSLIIYRYHHLHSGWHFQINNNFSSKCLQWIKKIKKLP